MSTFDFNHLNLAEVNPDIPALPDGEYTFVVIEAGVKDFTYKQDNPERGITAGQASTYVKFGLSVTDDAENAGRRVYTSLFPDNRAARYLRLIQDATGVIQEPGEEVNDWLKRLVEARATFKVPVYAKAKKDGSTDTAVRWGSISAA